MSSMPFVCGLDVGFSGLKLAFGNAAMEPVVRNLAAGSAPLAQMPKALDGDADRRMGRRVLVNGEPYVAGVRASQIQNYSRVLHEDYPASTEYMALFYAALLAMERDEIDVLVTGLPVNQHGDGVSRQALVERLQKVHFVDGERAVKVKRVLVLPQPVGAFMDQHQSGSELNRHGDARVLVVDPGFYSMDWVCIEERALRDASSGTTMDAMSKVLEAAVRDIMDTHRDKGVRVSVERLEDALREGRDTILVFGEPFDFRPYVTAAAEKVAASAINAIRSQMRSGDNLDFIVVAGGAASFYEEPFRRAFPRTKVLSSASPVLANARGFFYAARRAAKDLAA